MRIIYLFIYFDKNIEKKSSNLPLIFRSTKRKHISYDSLEIPQEMQVDQDVEKNAKPGKKSKKAKKAKNAFK